MKIAIPTQESKLDGEIATHFGRAKNFLIFDTKTEKFKVYQNPEVLRKNILPPDFLKKLKVDVIICFSLGLPAFNLFKNYNIRTKKAVKKNIKENISLFLERKLRDLNEKDIF